MFINLNYQYKLYRSKKKYTGDFSGYFYTNIEQQKAAIFFIDKLIKEANVDVFLVSIPRPQDFQKVLDGLNLDTIYWNKYLNDKSINDDNFTFIDLINYPPSNLDEMYLKCDGHWSPKGNLWAARIIAKYLKNN